MESIHQLFFQNACDMKMLEPGSVALMVTSPPYPMIEMWDELFAEQSEAVRKALDAGDGMAAFEQMHWLLDPVWKEAYRVLKPGGLACINIGDATRTIGSNFTLYPNHARILNKMLQIGFMPLPEILWRKQTNAPNKFMGSGMMPPGAYVTLEHEHVLILRKGAKREFISEDEKRNRRESAFFWEERNTWFSDVWMDLKGTTQKLDDNGVRHRSAAFPFELAYRLINMFSVKGDIVLDPFLGSGTTMAAAMASNRNSIGIELYGDFLPLILGRIDTLIALSNERIENRLLAHIDFVRGRAESKSLPNYRNIPYGFPVITNQETLLLFNTLRTIQHTNNTSFCVTYDDEPRPALTGSWEKELGSMTADRKTRPAQAAGKKRGRPPKQVQRKLPHLS